MTTNSNKLTEGKQQGKEELQVVTKAHRHLLCNELQQEDSDQEDMILSTPPQRGGDG